MVAETTLAPLSEEPLGTNDKALWDYLEARIAHMRGEEDRALSLLNQAASPGVHPAITYRVYNFRRHLLDLQRDHLNSAQLGAQLIAIAPSADQPALKRSVWHDLMRVKATDIEQAAAASTETEWRGWLALAAIANQDPTHIASELPQWQSTYPAHPAGSPLPGGLQYLQGTPAAPSQVALMLPLSGRLAPAGKAVRDGYLASYFTARKGNAAPYEVRIIDSNRYATISEAYQAAVTGGAGMVVGPLSKNAVAELALSPSRPVPVLALNQMDGALPPGDSALIQFALAPEDEAAQIAEVAFGDAARRALLLRPAGAWGDKMEQALRERWQTLGAALAVPLHTPARTIIPPASRTAWASPAARPVDARSVTCSQNRWNLPRAAARMSTPSSCWHAMPQKPARLNRCWPFTTLAHCRFTPHRASTTAAPTNATGTSTA
ncbi:hypothetical protein BST95_17570 [Halioglobus japonicus]|nr:hypothetical protein BST95_17570 [Halioglobus japonicus]